MSKEAEFLDRQAMLAKARLRQSARNLTEDLLGPFNIRPFIQRRPWWSLGGAAAAGFVSGLGLGRRRGKATGGQATSGKPAEGKIPRLLAMVNVRLRRVLRSALGAIIAANLRSAPAPAAPATNGRHGPTAAKTP